MRRPVIITSIVTAALLAASPLAFASGDPGNEVENGIDVSNSKNVKVSDNDLVDLDSTIQDSFNIDSTVKTVVESTNNLTSIVAG